MAIRLAECRSNLTSQSGENGVVDAILGAIGIAHRVAVEFGAYHLYEYSNIAPLWRDRGWRAVLIEGDAERFAAIVRCMADAERQHCLCKRVAVLNRWVRPRGPDSLDTILAEAPGPIPTDFDLLSIDIDSADLHIWDGLSRYRPRVVLVEYNPTIPPELDVEGDADGSATGASARALQRVGNAKGYSLVACTPSNCVFVRRELAHHFADADDLDALFDRTHLTYLISRFDGGSVLSRPPTFGYFPCSVASMRARGLEAAYTLSAREATRFPDLKKAPDPISRFCAWWLRKAIERRSGVPSPAAPGPASLNGVPPCPAPTR